MGRGKDFGENVVVVAAAVAAAVVVVAVVVVVVAAAAVVVVLGISDGKGRHCCETESDARCETFFLFSICVFHTLLPVTSQFRNFQHPAAVSGFSNLSNAFQQGHSTESDRISHAASLQIQIFCSHQNTGSDFLVAVPVRNPLVVFFRMLSQFVQLWECNQMQRPAPFVTVRKLLTGPNRYP